MKVFVADSSTLLREKLAGTLSGIEGVEIVGQERDSLEALMAIRELKPDVAVIDVRLLGRRGLDVLRGLKHDGSVPFVMMLAHDMSSLYRKECLGAGADFFLYKSSDLGKAMEILKELVALCEGTSNQKNLDKENE